MIQKTRGRCKVCGNYIYYNKTICSDCLRHQDELQGNKLICVMVGVVLVVWIITRLFNL